MTSHFPLFLDEVTDPVLLPPEGAWDTAAHVYDDPAQYPIVPGAKAFLPPYGATIERLTSLHDRLGIRRGVLVQPTSYGQDHSLLEHVLREQEGRFVGVALVSDDLDDHDLDRLEAAGVRGARFNLVSWLSTPLPIAKVRQQMERVAARGWSTALHLDQTSLVEHRDFLAELDQPTCIDHIAHLGPANADTHGEALACLEEMLENENVWIRLSNPDRTSNQSNGYHDALPLMRHIYQLAKERTLWGTDWPHVFYRKPHMVDDGQLVDLVMEVLPEPADRARVLVENPNRFYLGEDTPATGTDVGTQLTQEAPVRKARP